MERLLEEIEFRDSGRAMQNIARLSIDISPELQGRFRSLLAASADPDEALHYLECLHQEHPRAFHRVVASVTGLQLLIAVFSHSRFLAEAIRANPDWVEELLSSGELERPMSSELLRERLESIAGPGVPSPLSLALFRRRQILRIVARDLMGIAELPEVTEELSKLADAVLDLSYSRIRADLASRYGVPLEQDAGGQPVEARFCVLALGKLGGQELNYSSDIDLMFVYSGNGHTSGPACISNKQFFIRVSNQITDLLSTYTAAGLSYRVDLRLRPDGRFGEVAISMEGARSYYANRARDWELQMLLKARVCAGDAALGSELLDFVEPLIYSTTLDFSVVESASATRERIHEKAAARRAGSSGYNIKLTPGGIRDIEFLVQCLQRLHGGREPWVRHGGTMLALFRLRDKDLLSDVEYSRLASAYQFLRTLEHHLQILEDRQTHTLPAEPTELDTLARKIPDLSIGGPAGGERLLGQLNRHFEEVQQIYDRVIHAQQPVYYTPSPAAGPGAPTAHDVEPGYEPASNLVRSLDQSAPHLAAILSGANLYRGRTYFEHFLERVVPKPELLDWLNSDPLLASFVLDIFEHSPYFAEQLIRNPAMLADVRRERQKPGPDMRYQDVGSSLDDPGELRRFFRREMLRIEVESVCLQSPIFPTLERTSDLADAVISSAYAMALRQVAETHPPASADYTPENQMMTVTMGRLGMREFDLGSDADIIFVLPDRDVPEMPFWTRVAERMISTIAAYTGDGVIFAVDTRLRPNGRAGPLVQSEGAYKNYFATQAEAWEGITYMKCRAVAGNIERGTAFLNELQDVDWRRYGQSGRSRKQLAQMRVRVEKEQGPDNPLKTGFGGYYDIDFSLMYLRLKAAGFFFKVLNTPERIDVIEKMGHLERSDAEFLRDAATFYRAIDHGLRVSTGHAEGKLPAAGGQLETLTALVRRWTPEHLHDQDLHVELAQIQTRTREFFDRLFHL